jgi:hypothetical protein
VAAVAALFWIGGLAPLSLNPAAFYLAAYNDPPTQRVYDYFVGVRPRRFPRAPLPPAP